ncbi:MAG: type VI secretion system baseplate subunit TssK [Betaproteobacteria bacterium]|nr:type VI secretion system baseplate subunit TssK [Betaproteobacteria bacterium]
MNPTPALTEAVQWWEGMMLSPQHFQQNDIYWHRYLAYRMAAASPHAWGVQKLTIDLDQLTQGVVKVSELTCILPDGLVIEYPGYYDSNTKLEIDITEALEKSPQGLKVSLVVPLRGPAAARQGSTMQRFDAVGGEQMLDENTGDAQVSVERLRPRIDLMAGNSLPGKYCACPLLEVERDSKGHVRLTAYHPPMLSLDASAFLGEQGMQRRLAALAQSLWTKARELTGDLSDDSEEKLLSAESSQLLQVARHLGMGLPALNIAVTGGGTHPIAAYRALAQMVGHVAAIGVNPIPPKMEAYRHDDCWPQFGIAIDYMYTKLATVNSHYECLSFAQFGEFSFARHLSNDCGDTVLIELKSPNLSVTSLGHWLAAACVGSDDLLPHLSQRRLLGATVKPLSHAEIIARNLRPGSAMFELKNQHIEIPAKGLTEVFRPGRSLVIQGANGEAMPAGIVLYRAKTHKDNPVVGGGGDG